MVYFDGKLITPDSLLSLPSLRSAGSRGLDFDKDYCLMLSKTIRARVSNQALETHFLSREGQRLELPQRFHPLQEYLAVHRQGGSFWKS